MSTSALTTLEFWSFHRNQLLVLVPAQLGVLPPTSMKWYGSVLTNLMSAVWEGIPDSWWKPLMSLSLM